ncbi:MAG: DUF1634 domain-containing protein [Acidobacteriaceae bacterium]
MSGPTDHELELSVAGMLRFGVTAAAIVSTVGGFLYLRQPHPSVSHYKMFHAGSLDLRTISGIWHGAVHLDPRSMIQFGLVLLIATPIARVVFCVVGFARQRDRMYVIVSSIVLLVLLYSLNGGL